MSQENVDLLAEAVDAFDRHDLDAFLALMDDDVEAVPRMVSMEGSYRGHDGIRRWWKNWLDVFPDFNVEVVELRDLEDLTVAAVRYRAHGAGSDAPIEEMIGQVGRWWRGKCVRWESFDSQAEALEAVGLSE